MRQVDIVCTEKTCLSHMYDTSACNQHVLSNQIRTKAVVFIYYTLKFFD